jgi:hypothetical protein
MKIQAKTEQLFDEGHKKGKELSYAINKHEGCFLKFGARGFDQCY